MEIVNQICDRMLVDLVDALQTPPPPSKKKQKVGINLTDVQYQKII